MALTPETRPVNFANFPPGGGAAGPWSAEPRSWIAVTPSDTVALSPNCRGLWIGGAGAVAVKGVGNNIAATLTAAAAGTFIRGQFAYVMATNTTATLIVAACD